MDKPRKSQKKKNGKIPKQRESPKKHPKRTKKDGQVRIGKPPLKPSRLPALTFQGREITYQYQVPPEAFWAEKSPRYERLKVFFRENHAHGPEWPNNIENMPPAGTGTKIKSPRIQIILELSNGDPSQALYPTDTCQKSTLRS